MKTIWSPLHIMIICGISLLSIGCSRTQNYIAISSQKIDTEEISVSNNLVQIWSLLRAAEGNRDRFPKSLSELKLSPEQKMLFICPGTKTQPGSMDASDEWADYIYVGGVWDGSGKTALIISPPENYQGKYGYVLCAGLWVYRLPPNQIRALVRMPWLLDINSPPENINYLKEGIIVHVPKKFPSYF